NRAPGPGPSEAQVRPQVPETPARDVVGRGVIAVERARQADRRLLLEDVVDARGEGEPLLPVEAVARLDVVVGGRAQPVLAVGRIAADREADGVAAVLDEVRYVARRPRRVPRLARPVQRRRGRPLGDGAVLHLDPGPAR